MGLSVKEICGILTGYLLIVLSAASSIWIYVGLNVLKRITLLDAYNINLLRILLPTGLVAGCIIFGISGELVGRKITLLAISVPYAIAFLMFQFAKSVPVICIARVMAGLAVGGTHVVFPIYIGEIAPPKCRGFLGALMIVFYFVGLQLFRVLSAYTNYTVFNVTSICIAAIFSVLFAIIGSESPFYPKRKDIIIEEQRNSEDPHGSQLMFIEKIMPFCGRTGWIKSITMMMILICAYSLSGVFLIPMLLHHVYNYFVHINVEISFDAILILSIIFQLLGSLLCAALVDKIGRKLCLMISTGGIAILILPIAIFAAVREKNLYIEPLPILNIIFVCLFLVIFNFGLNPVPQILLGELFPLRLKMSAAAILVSIHQVFTFFIGTYFNEISWSIGYTTVLFIFMSAMVIVTPLIYFTVLETKQKSLNEIQKVLTN